MARTEAFTQEQVIEALASTGGIYTSAAKRLEETYRKPITGNGVRGYVERHEKVSSAYEEIRNTVLDMAESQLISNIKSGNMTAVIFYLKTQGKHRGYVERAELSAPGGKSLVPKSHDLSKLTRKKLEQLESLLEEAERESD